VHLLSSFLLAFRFELVRPLGLVLASWLVWIVLGKMKEDGAIAYRTGIIASIQLFMETYFEYLAGT